MATAEVSSLTSPATRLYEEEKMIIEGRIPDTCGAENKGDEESSPENGTAHSEVKLAEFEMIKEAVEAVADVLDASSTPEQAVGASDDGPVASEPTAEEANGVEEVFEVPEGGATMELGVPESETEVKAAEESPVVPESVADEVHGAGEDLVVPESIETEVTEVSVFEEVKAAGEPPMAPEAAIEEAKGAEEDLTEVKEKVMEVPESTENEVPVVLESEEVKAAEEPPLVPEVMVEVAKDADGVLAEVKGTEKVLEVPEVPEVSESEEVKATEEPPVAPEAVIEEVKGAEEDLAEFKGAMGVPESIETAVPDVLESEEAKAAEGLPMAPEAEIEEAKGVEVLAEVKDGDKVLEDPESTEVPEVSGSEDVKAAEVLPVAPEALIEEAKGAEEDLAEVKGAEEDLAEVKGAEKVLEVPESIGTEVPEGLDLEEMKVAEEPPMASDVVIEKAKCAEEDLEEDKGSDKVSEIPDSIETEVPEVSKSEEVKAAEEPPVAPDAVIEEAKGAEENLIEVHGADRILEVPDCIEAEVIVPDVLESEEVKAAKGTLMASEAVIEEAKGAEEDLAEVKGAEKVMESPESIENEVPVVSESEEVKAAEEPPVAPEAVDAKGAEEDLAKVKGAEKVLQVPEIIGTEEVPQVLDLNEVKVAEEPPMAPDMVIEEVKGAYEVLEVPKSIETEVPAVSESEEVKAAEEIPVAPEVVTESDISSLPGETDEKAVSTSELSPEPELDACATDALVPVPKAEVVISAEEVLEVAEDIATKDPGLSESEELHECDISKLTREAAEGCISKEPGNSESEVRTTELVTEEVKSAEEDLVTQEVNVPEEEPEVTEEAKAGQEPPVALESATQEANTTADKEDLAVPELVAAEDQKPAGITESAATEEAMTAEKPPEISPCSSLVKVTDEKPKHAEEEASIDISTDLDGSESSELPKEDNTCTSAMNGDTNLELSGKIQEPNVEAITSETHEVEEAQQQPLASLLAKPDAAAIVPTEEASVIPSAGAVEVPLDNSEDSKVDNSAVIVASRDFDLETVKKVMDAPGNEPVAGTGQEQDPKLLGNLADATKEEKSSGEAVQSQATPRSNSLLSKMKRSLVKVKKAIIKKSPSPKAMSAATTDVQGKDEIQVN